MEDLSKIPAMFDAKDLDDRPHLGGGIIPSTLSSARRASG